MNYMVRHTNIRYTSRYMAKLTNEDIRKLAYLCKLELTEAQHEKFRTEIEAIVDYVEQLQSVDVAGLEPTNQVTGLTNVTRPDEIRNQASKEQLLKNLPQREGDYIKVNQMIG